MENMDNEKKNENEEKKEDVGKKEKKKRNPPMSPFEKQILLEQKLADLKEKRAKVLKNANEQKTKIAGAILIPVLEDLGILENVVKHSKNEDFILKIQKILKDSLQEKKAEIEG